MMSESCFIWILILIVVQNSALWKSVLVVAFSASSISLFNKNIFSSIPALMLVMIYISGLMVLLVSVASFTYQELSFYSPKVWTVVAVATSFSFVKEVATATESFLGVSGWYEFQPYKGLFLIMMLLIVMMVSTYMTVEFKGMIRSM